MQGNSIVGNSLSYMKWFSVNWPGDSLDCVVTFHNSQDGKGQCQLVIQSGNRLFRGSFFELDQAPHIMAFAPGEGNVTVKFVEVKDSPQVPAAPAAPAESATVAGAQDPAPAETA